MDEYDALQYIFGDSLRHRTEDTGSVYEISVGEKRFEFLCREDYPNSMPEVLSNAGDDVLAEAARDARKYISTPMIFDIIRLVVRKLEKSGIKGNEKRTSTSWSADNGHKITEEDFRNWKMKAPRTEKPRAGKTGKEIFLERRRNKEDVQDDM
ncbi:hypothetical protein [Encephalitozoon cuniculi GB-M1]|uniref:Uncharacterized protein n=2 Tax=Encephalitozoon cuniculi TaxID=6035 RepID=Q8STQ8_ENCCU|nr:uncharacterized protein ECU09_1110 [Encephalitozoon cuniculi GB-M1]AGE96618.1 hypothetical protein ECU09_1110 [Encephalitozoon cuniculi]KMV65475.1 hypothetical protein M970_091130 [Encephalitozoon cuniculi EcunIII-L]UYI26799.1 RWD domain-containing protein [Encephalitozoon cuniculi]CAD27084.1 hypothetical protein [Encephalitozoon cuniculi GB-M1]